MTESSQRRGAVRRLGYRGAGYPGSRAAGGPGGNGRSPSVGERLRDAREARGVDLFRVERDTKIRLKYLEALEGGDFADLPGEVYARGFLRNYAGYLGLDPDEMVSEWRTETAETPAAAAPGLSGPRPVTIRRGIRFQRIHLVILGVVVIVALVGSYFGFQITRFLQYPTLALAVPSGTETIQVPSGTTSYILKGTATSGTTVTISWDGQDPNTVLVDDSGQWAYTAQLHFGSNQFDIIARNLDTNHASKTSRIIIVVPVVTPSPPQPDVGFTAPADGASMTGATVSVTGTAVQVSNVVLTVVYLGAPPAPGATASPAAAYASAADSPAPSLSLPPGASPAPSPASTKPAADGTFSFSLQLGPGRWQLALVGSDANGKSSPTVTRTVVVPYKGLTVLLQAQGGDAWMHYGGDGAAIGQSTYPDGWQVTLTLTKWFCVSTGKAQFTYVTINGVAYGPVSAYGGTHLYADTTHAPKDIAACPA